MGAGLAVPTIRYTGEQLLEDGNLKTTLVRINMEDFQCSVPSDIMRVNEKNVNKFPEVMESKEEFLKKLEKEKIVEGKGTPERGAMLIEMRASGLEGIKLIYDAVKQLTSP